MARRYRIIGIALAGTATLVVAGVLASNYARSDAPAQPLAFSHKLHAGERKIGCLYCHSYARRSPVAGVPSVQLCLGCHNNMQSDHPEIQKLKTYWDEKEPIPWNRVYATPDFVHFNHKRHVRAGVACQTCHGPVETMAQVRRVSSLEMGWCLQCHRERQASVDCATCHY
ncbi:MAG: cytochrome c3 family protein [Terriglobia bacterium]